MPTHGLLMLPSAALYSRARPTASSVVMRQNRRPTGSGTTRAASSSRSLLVCTGGQSPCDFTVTPASGSPGTVGGGRSSCSRALSSTPVSVVSNGSRWTPHRPWRASRVRFASPLYSHQNVTPYSEVYGEHPDTFDFDHEGNMVPSGSSPLAASSEITFHADGMGCSVNIPEEDQKVVTPRRVYADTCSLGAFSSSQTLAMQIWKVVVEQAVSLSTAESKNDDPRGQA